MTLMLFVMGFNYVIVVPKKISSSLLALLGLQFWVFRIDFLCLVFK